MITLTHSDVTNGNIAPQLGATGDVTLAGDWPKLRIDPTGTLDFTGRRLLFAPDFSLSGTMTVERVTGLVIEDFRTAPADFSVVGGSRPWISFADCPGLVLRHCDFFGAIGTGYPQPGGHPAYVTDAPWGLGLYLVRCHGALVEKNALRRERFGFGADRCQGLSILWNEFGSPVDPVTLGIGDDPLRLAEVDGLLFEGNRIWHSVREPGAIDTLHADMIHVLKGPGIGPSRRLVFRENLFVAITDPGGGRDISGIRLQANPGVQLEDVTVEANTFLMPFYQTIITDCEVMNLVVKDNALITADTGSASYPAFGGPSLHLVPSRVLGASDIAGNVVSRENAGNRAKTLAWQPSRVMTEAEALASVVRVDPADQRTWRIDPASPAYGAGWTAVRDRFGGPAPVPAPDPHDDTTDLEIEGLLAQLQTATTDLAQARTQAAALAAALAVAGVDLNNALGALGIANGKIAAAAAALAG